MKNRTTTLIIACVVSLFSTQSCLDLTEEVFDQISAENFGKNISEINSIVGPVYGTLRSSLWTNGLAISDNTGDMAITPTRLGGDWWDGGVYRDLHNHTWTAQTRTIQSVWNKQTSSITLCNSVLKTIETSPAIDEDTRTATMAEIRGIRAWWFYMMVDQFGGAPLVTDFDDDELPVMSSRQVVYDFLISELEEIEPYLTGEVTSSTYGKFTKGCIYMMKAKMYLNADAWGVSSGVSNNWQATIDECDKILALDYQLENDFTALGARENEGSLEAILAIPHSLSYGGSLHRMTHHYKAREYLGANFSGNNGICCQPGYAALFNDDADTRKAASFLMGQMYNIVTGEKVVTAHGRDLNHTAELTWITMYEGNIWGEVNQEDGWRCWKWPTEDSDITRTMENDCFIWRLADVYLMKAEAIIRNNGDNNEATSLVNAIRERAFQDSGHDYSSITLDEIALERKLEFAWEAHSRQDMIRFGTFQDARGFKADTHGQDHLLIFPIPQTALDANSNLVQNPGY